MRFLLILLLALAPYANALSKPVEVKSPDRNIVFSLETDSDGRLLYSLTVNGTPVLDKSVIGYASGSGASPKVDALARKGRKIRVRSEWKPLWGKRSVVPDRYNGQDFTVDFAGVGRATLQVRVYDDGAAFRFAELPAGKMTENTEFNFAGDYTAWFYNGERHNIGPEKLSESNGERLPVMTVKAAEDRYLAIHEAALGPDGWPMRLRSAAGSTSFEIIPETIEAGSPYTSAWRVMMCSDTPGGLVDSHLLELLNPAPEGDFSWVKPGVALWDWRIDGAVWDGYRYGMNYDSWTRMIDFAAEQGFSHLVLDANWYGPEFAKDSDPTKGDKARDVQRIIRYGRDKGVGVWLYLNDVAGTNYPIEETLAQYEQWGAAGVKYGFMNGTPQEKNRKTQNITALCAKHHLMVDYHDYPVHPFGQMRTWPNAVTREYCKAQLDGRQIFYPKTTAEIARTMITWSGATVIPDIPEYYRKYPRLLEFLSAEKQPWKESVTLDGRIGEYIVMMRQNAEGDYLVAAATNEDSRTLDIPLSFLPKGSWSAEDTDYRTNRETCSSYDTVVTSSSVLTVRLAPGGGACILLRPQPSAK